MTRISIFKIAACVLAAVLFGVGLTDGLFAVGGRVLALAHMTGAELDSQGRATSSEEAISEARGSDDREAIMPLSRYNVKGTPAGVDADAYLVGDLDTGEVIMQKNSADVWPIASVSKLMTALVAKDSIPSNTMVTFDTTAATTYGPSGGLTIGEKIRMGDLYYPMLMESVNDIAVAISEQLPSGEFIKKMNEKAHDIGMQHTYFEEASGLSKNNTSTASDLFAEARYIYSQEPEILDYTRTRQYATVKHEWTDANHMLTYPTFIGGKNGYTDEALRTSISLFNMPVVQGTTTQARPIAIIVLHTNTREDDIQKLYNFVGKNVSLEDK